MKQQLKLNESELHSIIEGAVKQLVMEYLPYEGGKVAARRLQQGDTSAFEKYMDYGINNGWTNDDMNDFQSGIETGPSVVEDEDFEDLNDGPINNAVDGSLEDEIAFEGKKAIKVNESQLFDIIKESVSKILTELDWKTYMNAARARQAQGNGNKASNLETYANNQFNQQHFGNKGYYGSNVNGNSAMLQGGVNTKGGEMHDTRDYGANFDGTMSTTKASGKQIHGYGKELVGNNRGYANKMQQRYSYDQNNLNGLQNVTDDYKLKMNNVGNDLDGYYNNKSKYVKGQGWQ